MTDRRIYICHADADRDFVRRLVDSLSDHLDLEPSHFTYRRKPWLRLGKGISRRTITAIASRPVFLAVLSPDALVSSRVQHELRHALAATKAPYNIHIFVVLCRPCEVPADLHSFPLVSFVPPIPSVLALRRLTLPILRIQWQHENARTLYQEGWKLYQRRRFAEAAVLLEYAVDRAPNHANTWTMLGLACRGARQFDRALPAFEEALSLSSTPTAALHSNRALGLLDLKRYEEALAAVETALRLDESFVLAWANKSSILVRLKRYEEALMAADRALALDARHAVAWNSRGAALSRLKRYKEAIQAYDRAIDVSPEHLYAWQNKVIALSRLRRYQEALVAARRTVELEPDDPVSWTNLSFVLDRLDRFEESLCTCERALLLDPNRDVTLNNMGSVLHRLGRSAEGMPYIDRALELSPDRPTFLISRGELLLALGQPELALAAIEHALTLDPEHAEGWRQKALVLHALSRENEAHEAERRAAELEE